MLLLADRRQRSKPAGGVSAAEAAAQGGDRGRRPPGVTQAVPGRLRWARGAVAASTCSLGARGGGTEGASEVLASSLRKAIPCYKREGLTRVTKLFYIRLNMALPGGLANRSSEFLARQAVIN